MGLLCGQAGRKWQCEKSGEWGESTVEGKSVRRRRLRTTGKCHQGECCGAQQKMNNQLPFGKAM